MRAPNIELGIYVDPYASPRAKQEARDIAERAGGNCIELTPPFKDKLPKGIFIAGGDGSIRKVIQFIVDSDPEKPIPIGLLGGGTNDAMRHALLLGKQHMTGPGFLQHIQKGFPSSTLIKPGLIGKEVFVRDVGLGSFEQNVGRANEALNGYSPRIVRVPIAYLLGLTQTILTQPEALAPLDIYTISPNIGRKHIFPQQTYQGDLITHAWIDEESRLKTVAALVKTAILWQFNIPSDAVKTKQRTRFDLESSPANLWFQGDTIPNTQQGPLVIKRWEKAIPIVAID